MPKHFTAILIALLLLPFFGGCNQKVADLPTEENPTTKTAQINSVAPQVDVATQPNTLPEKEATAKEVCERFLDLLAKGEHNLAGQLLTSRAMKVTVNAGLELEALGGEGSSVKLGDALYATNRAQVAQVPCSVTESNGESQSLMWMMRRSESGWRIAGLIVNQDKSQELLSFENRSDVAAIMGAKGGSADAEIRQVSATDDE